MFRMMPLRLLQQDETDDDIDDSVPTTPPTALSEFIDGPSARGIAAFFAVLAIVLSLWEIFRHLKHYSRPLLQRQIVRIILIVPIYAVGSLLSLNFPHGSLYFNTIRDIYEAYVIHSFLALMLDFPGGEPTVVMGIRDKPKLKHPIPFCCLPKMRLDHMFIQWCKRSTLQFVFLKPLTAVISLVLMMAGEEYYESHAWQYTLLVVYNISYTAALYGLLLFYMATKHLLKGFHAVGKFAAVKIIVFATYYQSLLVTAIPGMDTLGSSEKWNDFIICIEMFCFAVMHLYCFSHKEFLPNGVGMMNANRDEEDAPVNLKTDTTISAAFSRAADAFSIKDIMADAARNFSSRYATYIMAGVEGGIVTEGRADHHVMLNSQRARGPAGRAGTSGNEDTVVVVKERELGTDKESLYASAPDAVVVLKSTTGAATTRNRRGSSQGGDDMYGLIVSVDGATHASELKVAEPALPVSVVSHPTQPKRDKSVHLDTDPSSEGAARIRAPSKDSSLADGSFDGNLGAVAASTTTTSKAALLAASANSAAAIVQAAAKQRQLAAAGINSAIRRDDSAKSDKIARQGGSTRVKQAASAEKVKFAGQDEEDTTADDATVVPMKISQADELSTVKSEMLATSLVNPSASAWQPEFGDSHAATPSQTPAAVRPVTEASPIKLSERQLKASARLHSLKISAANIKPVSSNVTPVQQPATITADPSTWEFTATSNEEEETPLPLTEAHEAQPTASEWHTSDADTNKEGVVDFSNAMVSTSHSPEPITSPPKSEHAAEPSVVAWDATEVEFKTAPLGLKPPPAVGPIASRRAIHLANMSASNIGDNTADEKSKSHGHTASDARVAFAQSTTSRRKSLEGAKISTPNASPLKDAPLEVVEVENAAATAPESTTEAVNVAETDKQPEENIASTDDFSPFDQQAGNVISTQQTSEAKVVDTVPVARASDEFVSVDNNTIDDEAFKPATGEPFASHTQSADEFSVDFDNTTVPTSSVSAATENDEKGVVVDGAAFQFNARDEHETHVSDAPGVVEEAQHNAETNDVSNVEENDGVCIAETSSATPIKPSPEIDAAATPHLATPFEPTDDVHITTQSATETHDDATTLDAEFQNTALAPTNTTLSATTMPPAEGTESTPAATSHALLPASPSGSIDISLPASPATTFKGALSPDRMAAVGTSPSEAQHHAGIEAHHQAAIPHDNEAGDVDVDDVPQQMHANVVDTTNTAKIETTAPPALETALTTPNSIASPQFGAVNTTTSAVQSQKAYNTPAVYNTPQSVSSGSAMRALFASPVIATKLPASPATGISTSTTPGINTITTNTPGMPRNTTPQMAPARRSTSGSSFKSDSSLGMPAAVPVQPAQHGDLPFGMSTAVAVQPAQRVVFSSPAMPHLPVAVVPNSHLESFAAPQHVPADDPFTAATSQQPQQAPFGDVGSSDSNVIHFLGEEEELHHHYITLPRQHASTEDAETSFDKFAIEEENAGIDEFTANVGQEASTLQENTEHNEASGDFSIL